MTTETDIRQLLNRAGLKPTSISIKRDDESSMANLKSRRLDEYIASWTYAVPNFTPQTIMTEFRNEKKSLIGVLVTYETAEHARQAYEKMPIHLASAAATQVDHLHSLLQYEVEYSGTYSLHNKLYETFRKSIEAITNRFERDMDVISIRRQEKTDERKQPKVIFYIKTSRLEKVRQVQKQLDSTIEFEIYNNKLSATDKTRLFSAHGRSEMMRISDQVAYLHWEMRTGMIRIYGDEQKRQCAREILDRFFVKFADMKQEIVELNRAGVRFDLFILIFIHSCL